MSKGYLNLCGNSKSILTAATLRRFAKSNWQCQSSRRSKKKNMQKHPIFQNAYEKVYWRLPRLIVSEKKNRHMSFAILTAQSNRDVPLPIIKKRGNIQLKIERGTTMHYPTFDSFIIR